MDMEMDQATCAGKPLPIAVYQHTYLPQTSSLTLIRFSCGAGTVVLLTLLTSSGSWCCQWVKNGEELFLFLGLPGIAKVSTRKFEI